MSEHPPLTPPLAAVQSVALPDTPLAYPSPDRLQHTPARPQPGAKSLYGPLRRSDLNKMNAKDLEGTSADSHSSYASLSSLIS